MQGDQCLSPDRHVFHCNKGELPGSLFARPCTVQFGDGVYGLPRRRHMMFQQWASYLLTRTELAYTCPPMEEAVEGAPAKHDEAVSLATDCAGRCPAYGSAGRRAMPDAAQEMPSANQQATACTCAQCMKGQEPFLPPSQPRWSSDHAFLCAVWDCWRRMEIIR